MTQVLGCAASATRRDRSQGSLDVFHAQSGVPHSCHEYHSILQKSLRAQILALLGGSLLAMLLIALACFHFLSSGVQSYANLIDGPLHTSQLIDEANLQFKVQVQEQTGAVDAAQAIESGQSRSEESVAQVTEAGAMLERITHAVEAIRDMNRQIATAAEEQTSVAEDISRNLTEITTIASTNLDNVQRTEAASHNLHGLSGQLNEVTARLSA
ncbi:hypothetical protein ABH906_000058 [Pseudomonas frederiksbergensis]